MAEDKIVTTIDYNVKVGKQRLDLLTKAITRVDSATGTVTQTTKKYVKGTDILVKSSRKVTENEAARLRTIEQVAKAQTKAARAAAKAATEQEKSAAAKKRASVAAANKAQRSIDKQVAQYHREKREAAKAADVIAKSEAKKRRAEAKSAADREKKAIAYVRASNKQRRAIEKVNRANKRLSRSSRRAARGMGLMGAAGNRMRYGIIGLFGGALGAAGIGMVTKGIFDSVSRVSDTTQKLGPMFKDQAAALKAFRTESERTGVSAHELAEGFVNLRRRGFDQTMSADIVALGEDIGSTQADPRATTRVINAIGQIKGKGKLSTEELNQLAEGGGLARGELLNNILKSRGMGTDKKDIAFINKELETGQITSEEGIDSLFKTYLDMYNIGRKEKGLKLFDRPGQMAEEIGKTTVRGNLRRMKTTFENLTDSLSVMAGPGISRGLAGITKTIQDISKDPEKMQSLSTAIERIGMEFADLGTETLPAMSEWMTKFLKGWIGIEESGENSKTFAKSMADAIRESIPNAEKMGNKMRSVATSIKNIVDKILKVIGKLEASPVLNLLAKAAGGVDMGVGALTDFSDTDYKGGSKTENWRKLGRFLGLPGIEPPKVTTDEAGNRVISPPPGASPMSSGSGIKSSSRGESSPVVNIESPNVTVESAPNMSTSEVSQSISEGISSGFSDVMSDVNWQTGGQ